MPTAVQISAVAALVFSKICDRRGFSSTETFMRSVLHYWGALAAVTHIIEPWLFHTHQEPWLH